MLLSLGGHSYEIVKTVKWLNEIPAPDSTRQLPLVHQTGIRRALPLTNLLIFPVPLVSLSPADLFAQEIVHLSLLKAASVAPDEGARDRCQAVASCLSSSGDTAPDLISSHWHLVD